MTSLLLAFEPGPGGGSLAIATPATLGFTGFCAVVLLWCSVIWGWWRVLIIALAATPFTILGTLAFQGFGILAAFGDLVGQASSSAAP